MEAVLVLAVVSQRFRLDVVPGQDISLWATTTLRLKNGISVRVNSRDDVTEDTAIVA